MACFVPDLGPRSRARSAAGSATGSAAVRCSRARTLHTAWMLAAWLLAAGCRPDDQDVEQTPDVQVGRNDAASSDGVFGDSTTTSTGKCGTDSDCDGFALSGPPCTYAVCQVGHCVRKTSADGAACEDGNDCTLGDHCLGGSCQAGAAKSCEDGNPCTIRACEPVGGACSATPTEIGCTSAKGCHVGVCSGGGCQEASTYLQVDLPAATTMAQVDNVRWASRGPSRLLLGVGAASATASSLTLLDLAGAVVAHLPQEVTRALGATPDGYGFVVVGSDGADALASDAAPGSSPGSTPGSQPGQGIATGLDAQGNVLWRAAYGTSGDDRLDGVARRSDGTYVAVGTRKLDAAAIDGKVPPGEGWFVAFHPGGSQLADFFYAGPTETRLHDVVAVGLDALVGGSQRTTNGKELRPLLARVGVDGSLQSIAQPKHPGRVMRLQRRSDGVVAALVADADGSGPVLLLFDSSWLQLATIPLADPVGLRAFDASWRPDGSALVAGAVPGGAGNNATLGWLGHVGPWGALQFGRVVPTLIANQALLPGDDALWLAGPATATGADGAVTTRALRVDAWGFGSCEEAGSCATKGTECDDGNPCTVDSCDPAAGCQHSAMPDASACGVAKTCLQGACGG